MNTKNSPSKGDYMLLPDFNFSCNLFKQYNINDFFEWDENKNQKNKHKHQIGFERAVEIYQDPNLLQMVETPDKWEEITDELFEEKEVERNTGNLDPIRGKIIGMLKGKLYTFIYTFRHEVGDMTYRIISLRQSSDNEAASYWSVQMTKK